jgi:hypothetical protein
MPQQNETCAPCWAEGPLVDNPARQKTLFIRRRSPIFSQFSTIDYPDVLS